MILFGIGFATPGKGVCRRDDFPSIKLHEKMGFKREGQLRNMVFSRGEFFDEIYYGMTRVEFDELFA